MSKFILILALTACATSAAPPDEPPPPPPIDPSGHYVLNSTYQLTAPPASAAPALAELRSATDGPDDPSRYLLDLVIAQLPEEVQRYARVVAPILAAYLNERITTVAPHFLDGMHALADGLHRISLRFGTRDDFRIDGDRLRRTLVAFAYDGVTISVPEVGAATSIAIDGDTLSIGRHEVTIEYGDMLRLGFDRVVIPNVVPKATDLSHALRELVDCKQLGIVTADWLAFGSPSIYEQACAIALTTVAAKIYDALPRSSALLIVEGTAHAVDHDRNGTLDAIEAGVWTGTVGDAPLGLATFDGEGVGTH